MFSNKKKFFKQLEPGTILHQHFLLGHSRWFMLFEFGHFDDASGYVYWQRAKVKFQDDMVFVDTAVINNDLKLYEQKEMRKFSEIGIVRKANRKEILLFMHKTSTLMSFEKDLKPFSTKVLVSDGQGDIWRPAIFGCIVDDDVQRYMIVGGQKFKYCVPYRHFKKLLGKKFENVPNMV